MITHKSWPMIRHQLAYGRMQFSANVETDCQGRVIQHKDQSSRSF